MDERTFNVFIAAIAGVVTLGTLIIQSLNLRKTMQTHSLVNGMTERKELLQERAANAEGRLAGVADEQARVTHDVARSP